ncbi:hypothetical protein MUP59_07020 [Candidatus Bathyarchaeota archaeon]|nr:hypothetical protein [Candidatus Bathyarchaeota archaeon]
MTGSIVYKEFYNKDRGLPEPIWGKKTEKFEGVSLQCPTCGSKDMYYSAHPDDPEEVLTDNVRCKNCGHITDRYESYKQGLYHSTNAPMKVVRENPMCSSQEHVLG